MKIAKGVLVAVLALLPANAMAEDIIKIGLFNRDAAIIAAIGKGFLKQENIRAEINTVTDSPTLLRNLITGKYDLILNNADNVIAWAEGQGEDPQKNDFVIFLGGSQGVDQKLVVAPSINGYADLKGKILAADAVTTGYAVVAMAILKKHGLEWKRDYEVKSFGNTRARADAMSRGDASGAMMSMPEEEIQKRGFKVLAKSEDYVKNYARGLGATRRDWANANEDLVVRFNRAMIRATDWLQDQKTKTRPCNSAWRDQGQSRPRRSDVRQHAQPDNGSDAAQPHRHEGIRTVIELREIAGLMKAPVPKPEKYVDERFYKKALENSGEVNSNKDLRGETNE